MSSSDLLFHAGHRERLKEKLLDNKLAPYELLELLLTYSIPRRDVRPLARALLQKFGGVYFVLRAPIEELMAVSGIGRNTAILIKLFNELSSVSYQERATSGDYLADPKFINDYCRDKLSGLTIEEFHVLYLGANSKLLLDETHTRGTIDQSAVYPREIAKQALRLNALGVILMHNHPMSDNSFSSDDISITEEIISVLQSININFIDHLVVTCNGVIHSWRASPWIGRNSFSK